MAWLVECPLCGRAHEDDWCETCFCVPPKVHLENDASEAASGGEGQCSSENDGFRHSANNGRCDSDELDERIVCGVCGFPNASGERCGQCGADLRCNCDASTHREARPVLLRLPSGNVASLELGKEELVGRESPNPDIESALKDLRTVSRRHCSLFVSSDGRAVTVRDVGSTNGTWVGDDCALLGAEEMVTVQIPARIRLGRSVELLVE